MSSFILDPRLRADGPPLLDLPLCHVRLVDDARFVWLVLVPARDQLVEILDLSPAERTLLMAEIAAAGAAVREVSKCAKLNVAALGNVVSQLHVHVVGRDPGDAAWPAPVFGFGVREPMDEATLADRFSKLRGALLRA
ncbi:HIT family protein [Xanthobacter sp. KR7-225]|uniref:HIT family protein n=1 Tax=Xanthobacter sp. KR7-225 TaxID=3156613 RepID=UPI0032B37878